MSHALNRPEKSSGSLGFQWVSLVVLAGTILLWWRWLSALAWARGADFIREVSLSKIPLFLLAFGVPLSLIVWSFLYRRPRSIFFRLLILAMSLADLIAIGRLWLAFEMETEGFLTCVTNPKRYQEMVNRSLPWQAHFPASIPTNATGVHFSFAHFMQGSTFTQLKVKIPPKEVEAILAEYKPKADAVWPTAQSRDYRVDPRLFSPSRGIWGTGWSVEPFPDRYLILYLGWSCGIAIDFPASEVIYWAEDQ